MKTYRYAHWLPGLAAILTLLMLVSFLPAVAQAETLTGDLITLESTTNLAIAVTYTDNGTGTEPQISFESPRGELYQEGVTAPEVMTVERRENTIIFYIVGAQAGNWKILYDSSFSGHLQVNMVPFARDMTVEYFNILEMTDSQAKVSFQATFPESKRFHYIISAVVSDSNDPNAPGITLETGTSYTNQETTVTVSLSELVSYRGYRFKLEVYLDDYDIETGDTALSDPFDHTDPDTPDMLEDFNIVLDRTSGDLTVDWTDVANHWASEYILGVFTSLDEAEPSYANIFGSDITCTSLLIDPNADWVRVELCYKNRYGNISTVKAITFDIHAVELEILTGDSTASAQAQVQYNIPDGPVELYLYTESQGPGQPKSLSGSGTTTVAIAEGENRIIAAYHPYPTVTVMESKEVYSDRKAPPLTFLEKLDSLTTSQSVFHLAGITEAGAALAVDGKEVAINADGSFLIELKLQSGANRFEITATDAAGNQSRRTLLINCADVAGPITSGDVPTFWEKWGPLILGGAGALVLLVLILCLFVTKQKRTAMQLLTRFGILGWVIGGAGAAASVWLLIEKNRVYELVNSKAFYELVLSSVEEAYAAMVRLEELEKIVPWVLIATGVILLISLVLTLIPVIAKHRKRKPAAPVPAPAPVQEPKPAPVQEPKPTPAVHFCPKCGTRCKEDAIYCPGCGHKLK